MDDTTKRLQNDNPSRMQQSCDESVTVSAGTGTLPPPISTSSSRDLPGAKKVSWSAEIDDDDDDDVELTPEHAAQMEDLARRLENASRVPNIDLDAILDPSHPSNAKYFSKSTRQILRDRDQDQDSESTTSSEPTSSEGESDSEDDSEDDDEDAEMSDANNNNHSSTNDNTSSTPASIPRLTARQKPHIRKIGKDNDILSRLSAFLPKMKDANETLERDIAAGKEKDLRLDDVDDEEEGGRYIEMNLGLGVLEEKRPDGDASSDELDEDPEPTQESNVTDPSQGSQDSNVLGKLMGKKKGDMEEKPTIEEIND